MEKINVFIIDDYDDAINDDNTKCFCFSLKKMLITIVLYVVFRNHCIGAESWSRRDHMYLKRFCKQTLYLIAAP